MDRLIKKLALGILVACLPVYVWAQSLQEFVAAARGERGESARTAAAYILGGAGTAFMAANVELERNNTRSLFCEPGLLALNRENYVRIFLDEYSRDERYASSSFGGGEVGHNMAAMVLLEGLKRTFPCPKGAQR